MSVGEKILLYLKKHGISQKFLSEKTKIPLARLNLSLHNHRKLTFAEYEAVCGALDVSVDQFLTPRKP